MTPKAGTAPLPEAPFAGTTPLPSLRRRLKRRRPTQAKLTRLVRTIVPKSLPPVSILPNCRSLRDVSSPTVTAMCPQLEHLRGSTPLRSVRARCLDCAENSAYVRNCMEDNCPLHPIRMGKGSRTVLKPIRRYCLWCCAGSEHEVRLCTAEDCSLHSHRFGKRPRFAQERSVATPSSAFQHEPGLPTLPREQAGCKCLSRRGMKKMVNRCRRAPSYPFLGSKACGEGTLRLDRA
jgi:hypothetical protein